jgi:hypothetical protein
VKRKGKGKLPLPQLKPVVRAIRKRRGTTEVIAYRNGGELAVVEFQTEDFIVPATGHRELGRHLADVGDDIVDRNSLCLFGIALFGK